MEQAAAETAHAAMLQDSLAEAAEASVKHHYTQVVAGLLALEALCVAHREESYTTSSRSYICTGSSEQNRALSVEAYAALEKIAFLFGSIEAEIGLAEGQ